MSGADYILAINLFVAGLLAGSFAMVAAYDKANPAPRWLAASYLLGMAYFGCEALIPVIGDSRFTVPVAFGTFLAAMVAFNVGLAHTYRIAAPWRLMGALFVVSVVVVYLIQDMPRQSIARMMLYQGPYALMQLVGVGIVVASPRIRRHLDLALTGLLAASTLQFLSKPFLAWALDGWGANPQVYLDSAYAMISQSIGAVFGIAIALMTLVILVSDILSAATEKSETDALSGLLNRRGFEARAELAVRDAVRQGIAMSLVICDIDHFKAVNDSLGHASGDRVIAAFAGFLKTAAANHHAGRIGGEEFAVILPGTNLVAARLFAESARSAFAALRIQGVPHDRHFTASFGVAELAPGEHVADLLVRADSALYEAKNNGRDCVRVAPPRPISTSRRLAG